MATEESGQAPTAFARDREVARRPLADWLGLLGVAAIVVFTGAGSRLAFDLDRAGGPAFWGFAIGPTLVVAVIALVRAARDGDLAHMVRPEWGDATRGILSAALLLGAAVAFSHVVTPEGSPRSSWMARVYLQLGDPGWLRAHTGMVAGVLLVAAAGEEIVWRGLVTQLLAERVGSRFAWAWATIPYALSLSPTVWTLRDPEAGLNPLLVLAALGLGLVWGGMARWTKRLPPSILSHAAFDWCVIVLFRLWGSGG
jgi:membrane protease YdiL (CAAX protease family)